MMVNNLLINIVIPVYNEESILVGAVRTVCGFLQKNIVDNWQITIADNASTDSTLDIARQLAKSYKNVRVIHLDQKGRGRALKKAWNESNADVLCYMDADLATDLNALPRMINAIKQGAAVATGNRFDRHSIVRRDLYRMILSKGYNAIAKLVVKTKIDDLQCGFKAISRKAKEEILPQVQDNAWFFDSELLILAEKQGCQIAQIPVKWTESQRTSRVHIVNTVNNYIKNLLVLRKRLKKQGIL